MKNNLRIRPSSKEPANPLKTLKPTSKTRTRYPTMNDDPRTQASTI